MKYIDNFFNQIKYIFEQSQFTSQEFLLLAVVGLICLYVILWIPTRGLRLWYWKTNKQLEVLRTIDEKLNSLKENISDEKNNKQLNTDDLKPSEESESQEVEEALQNEAKKQLVPNKPVVLAIPGYNVGKSGKVYSIEEIESIIKD